MKLGCGHIQPYNNEVEFEHQNSAFFICCSLTLLALRSPNTRIRCLLLDQNLVDLRQPLHDQIALPSLFVNTPDEDAGPLIRAHSITIRNDNVLSILKWNFFYWKGLNGFLRLAELSPMFPFGMLKGGSGIQTSPRLLNIMSTLSVFKSLLSVIQLITHAVWRQ